MKISESCHGMATRQPDLEGDFVCRVECMLTGLTLFPASFISDGKPYNAFIYRSFYISDIIYSLNSQHLAVHPALAGRQAEFKCSTTQLLDVFHPYPHSSKCRFVCSSIQWKEEGRECPPAFPPFARSAPVDPREPPDAFTASF